MTTEGPAEELPWYDRSDLARLILDVRGGRRYLDGTEFDGYRYPATAALALIRACVRSDGGFYIPLGGRIEGDLVLPTKVTGRLHIRGEITGQLDPGDLKGELVVGPSARIGGFIFVWGTEIENLRVVGKIESDLILDRSAKVGRIYLLGSVGGKLDIRGEVMGELRAQATIGGGVVFRDGAKVGGLDLSGEVAGEFGIRFDKHARVGSSRIHSKVERSIYIEGSIDGDLYSSGHVSENVTVLGPVEGRLSVTGTVERRVWIRGVVDGDLLLAGDVAELVLGGELRGSATVFGALDRPLVLKSVVGAKFDNDVMIGDYVSIEDCDFRRCLGLRHLIFVGSFAHLFPSNGGLRNTDMAKQPDELASINRQLRSNLERRRNRPASNLFYRGEMDARRAAARSANRWSEWFVLAVYWMVSGYGLRAWRPTLWFAIVALIGTALFAWSGLDLDDGVDVAQASVAEVAVFTFRSMIAFFSPPSADLAVPQEWLQIGLRFAGPALVAQAILAVRERVAR